MALIVGGHTFGKTHGAAVPDGHVGPEPEAAPLQQMGLGWANSFGTGVGDDAITSGLEGAWTPTPTTWDNSFLETLFGYEWDLSRSPAGAYQWVPTDPSAQGTVPDPHDPSKRHAPVMLTSDLALRMDPIYEPIARRFLEHPEELADAFARAWFKLTHRDMGPKSRYLGPEVPAEDLIWQDPVPAPAGPLVDADDVAVLKAMIIGSGLSISQLVSTAWASAATFRGTDKRGGTNGARVRLEPQNAWEVNDPEQLAIVLAALEAIREEFNARGGAQVSLADLIVIGGNAAVEVAAKAGGLDVEVPFTPGRTDATAEQTDVHSFTFLEPTFDGFRNYLAPGHTLPAERLLVERAALLTLSAPETAVLVGGLRVLGANTGGSPRGVLTSRPGTLSNDFFTAVVDMGTVWTPTDDTQQAFEGRSRATGEVIGTASRVDLVFGSNSQLRALAEVYAADDANDAFVADFVAAWAKVMDLGRYDRP